MWLSSRGTTHTPRDGAELRAKGVSEEGLGGHCRQQGRPSLCQGSGEAIRMSLPVGSLLSLLAWSAHWVSQVTRTSALLLDQGLGPGRGTGTPGGRGEHRTFGPGFSRARRGTQGPLSPPRAPAAEIGLLTPGFLHLLLPLGLSAPPASGLLAVEHLNSAPTTRANAVSISPA